jgi:4-hydroxybenzoate polyprenyltransferase
MAQAYWRARIHPVTVRGRGVDLRQRGRSIEGNPEVGVAQRTSSSRALVEVILAIVLVVAVASILLAVLGWLAGALWWLFKIAVLVIVIYVIARILLSRHGSGS